MNTELNAYLQRWTAELQSKTSGLLPNRAGQQILDQVERETRIIGELRQIFVKDDADRAKLIADLEAVEIDRVRALQQLGKTQDYVKTLQNHVREFWDVLKPHLPSTLRQKLNAAFDRLDQEKLG